jgi:hypothetical protein
MGVEIIHLRLPRLLYARTDGLVCLLVRRGRLQARPG